MPGSSLVVVASAWAGVLDRPARTPLGVAVLFIAAAVGLHVFAWWATRPPRPAPGPAERPPAGADGPESAALVGLLTNGFAAPRSAIVATAVDLAARGWIRLAHADGELIVVTKSSAAAGDSLRPYEQLVLNHLVSRSFNDVVSGITLAAAQRRLGMRWWRRFARAVGAEATGRGLATARYSLVQTGPVIVALLVVAEALRRAASGGAEVAVADSWASRGVWLATLATLIWLAWRTAARMTGGATRPTPLGAERAALWLGYRARLADRIPSHASVVGTAAQQDPLARAYVMGLCRQVGAELPVAPEDPRHAWSEAGTPHVVIVRYPVRPGYGQNPLKVLIAGLITLLVAWWLRRFFGEVADGTRLTDLLDRAPGRHDLFEGFARALSILCWVPIVASLWAIVAGAVDTVIGRSRTGQVVRTRQPHEVLPRFVVSVVKPFGERSGFSTYLAVDDGRRDVVIAWLASERSAAPQGAQARVVATPLLGYVRASEPIGSSTR